MAAGVKSSSPIAAALEQLELERANLAARLTKVDAAIANMRELFHLPRAPKVNGHAKVRVEAHAQPTSNGRGAASADAIVAALRHHGPMTPRDLAAAMKVKPYQVSYQAKKLAAQGLVRLSGSSNARRITLAERSAKEAP